MFVGRKSELDSLNKSFNRNAFQFAVIYGRRRVGKTTLINEFIRTNKQAKTIYFVAIESTLKVNLEIMSAQILTAIAPDAPKNPFATFREALEYVFETAKKERVIFAIDEYPYLAKCDKSVSSVLQAAIDKYQQDSKLFLILCGSSMSFMEKQVLGYTSPLYGRRTAQYKIAPFDYLQSAQMLPRFSNEEKITLYSVTGGTPEYLSRIDNTLSVEENIQALFFDTSGRLFEEPASLLKQELRIPETYNSIITAIADGSSKINEIATKVGIETSQCSKMLSTLVSLGLVSKNIPITEVNSKKTIYALSDFMFIFWYRFVQPELSRIAAGFGNDACAEVFAEKIMSHTGFAFEECAKQYMWHALRDGRSPIAFRKIGKWWGNNPKERQEEEIDFIAFSGEKAVFSECKWRNTQVGVEVLDNLMRKSELFARFKDVHFMLFSKSGFTTEIKNKAKSNKNISLVGTNDMFDF